MRLTRMASQEHGGSSLHATKRRAASGRIVVAGMNAVESDDVHSSGRFQEIADIAEHVVSEIIDTRCTLHLSSN
jgi:hypothetical protein